MRNKGNISVSESKIGQRKQGERRLSNNFKIITINRHRMTTDGNGVTSLVALPGCPLHCKYCINNDILENPKYKEYAPEQLVERVMIDYCYFLSTGGGITFGGGESLLWAESILEFRRLLRPEISVNVETSLNIPFKKYRFSDGDNKNVTDRADTLKDICNIHENEDNGDWSLLDELLENISEFIIDTKAGDDAVYLEYTGITNEYFKENLEHIVSRGMQHKCKLRVPIIPNHTTRDDAIRDAKRYSEMGFKDIEVFNYVLK